MSIQLDGTLVSTTMRTPGHDFELAAGFCFTEGMLDGAAVTGVRYCADGSAVESEFNIVTVETGGRAPTPTPRLGNTSSSCGICGTEQLDDLASRLAPLPPSEPFDLALLHSIPGRVVSDQHLFATTGASHAAAAFDRDGLVLVVREDVGRHNAVDKVVGSLVLRGQARRRTGALHQWSGEHRDDPEGVGGRVLHRRIGQRPDRTGGRRRPSRRDHARRLPPPRRFQPLHLNPAPAPQIGAKSVAWRRKAPRFREGA